MSQAPETPALLVADTSVLVNLAILDRLDLFAATGFDAHVPNHVLQEVTRADQRTRVNRALTTGHLVELEITDIAEMTEFARLRKRFGKGESAAVAVALSRRWAVAVDDGAVHGIVRDRLGAEYLLTTPCLLNRAVRASVIDISEIPGMRAILAANRYALVPLEIEKCD